MSSKVFLVLNLALSFYPVGAIWAVEVDLFRSWKLIDPKNFPKFQSVHWRKLPFWIFIPLALALTGSIVDLNARHLQSALSPRKKKIQCSLTLTRRVRAFLEEFQHLLDKP